MRSGDVAGLPFAACPDVQKEHSPLVVYLPANFDRPVLCDGTGAQCPDRHQEEDESDHSRDENLNVHSA